MNYKIKGLFKNIALLSILQGANYLIPLIVLPYLVRVLGPERFGLLAFAQAFMQYFILFTDYGFNLTATQKIAVSKGDADTISKICSNVLIIKGVLLIASFLFMFGVISLIPSFRHNSEIYLLCFVQVIGTSLFPIWFFQGMESMKPITIINIFSRLLAAVGIFIFIKSKEDLLAAAGIQAFGWLLAGSAGFFYMLIFMKIRLKWPGLKELKETLIDGWHVFISIASTSLYTISNAFVLGLITNNTVVGFFTAAEKLIKAIIGFINPISQSIYPFINSLAKESKQNALAFLRLALKWIGIGGVLASIFLLLFSSPIVEKILGPQYLPSLSSFRLMAFLPLALGISNILGIQTMLTFGLKKQFSRILVFSGIFNVAILIPLAYLFSAEGAALAVLITECIVTLLMFITLKLKGFSLISLKGAKV